MHGVKLEIQDSGYELVSDVIATTDPAIAFQNADVAILLGGFPRKPNMLRKDLISMNAVIMLQQV
jgi:malate/lactate dehydrogenase